MAKMGSGHRLALVAMVQIVMLAGLTNGAGLAISKRGLLDPFVPSSVCYGDLGCFSTGGNFYNPLIRPVQELPWSPDVLNPTFLLFTRSNILDANVIRYNDRASVTGSRFDPQKPTKIITHGWTDSGDSAWLVAMKKALLAYGDYNVIQLDWRVGSRALYTQSVSNTRVVGAMVGRMVKWLEREFGASRENFHISGHSLGSHVAGYAGASLREEDGRQLGRITGLDPAGPYFENTHPEVRLDPTDARFVDAIHTDAPSLNIESLVGCGIAQPVGHVDFYPNGGSSQPGCPRGLPSVMADVLTRGLIVASVNAVACDHSRVTDLYTNTILNPTGDFRGYECDGYAEFRAGRCLKCSGTACPQMGLRAAEWAPNGRQNVKVFLDTQPTPPYYLHHYSVKVKLASSGFSRESGDMSVTLVGSDSQATTPLPLLTGGSMEAGQDVQGLVTSSAPVADVNKVSVGWKSNSLLGWFTLFGAKKIAVGSVEVLEGSNQKTNLFCGYGATIDTGSSKTFNKC